MADLSKSAYFGDGCDGASDGIDDDYGGAGGLLYGELSRYIARTGAERTARKERGDI